MKISKKKLIKFTFNSLILLASIIELAYYFYILTIYPFFSKTLTGITGLGVVMLVIVIFGGCKSYDNLRNMYLSIKK